MKLLNHKWTLGKSANHKYLERKPDGKGGYNYKYNLDGKSSYIKLYPTQREAEDAMRSYNGTLSDKALHKMMRVVIEGPENNFAVVDRNTAHEMGVGYTFSGGNRPQPKKTNLVNR
jgi:hypothetical protein